MGGKGSGQRLTKAERREVRRLTARGYSPGSVAEKIGRSPTAVVQTLERVAEPVWEPGPGRLSAEEREAIAVGLALGDTFAEIARKLERAVSTVSREVHANGGPQDYRACRAHAAARERARRPKPAKLANPVLAAEVTVLLEALWSPEEIANWLRAAHPDDPMMQVSYETIYLSLFVQGRGELRRELARCLRTGRAKRRPRGRLHTPGTIVDMVMISQRPAEVADRAVPGHWEGDLIIGQNGASAVGTLVERYTRYVMLLALPNGRDAEHVRLAMIAAIGRLPAELIKTVTWDQGKEMAQHAQLRIDTGVQIYFCDPHSPWQRGSNENTNGLLRDYMPKGYDLSPLTQDNLDVFAHSLNTRPRKTLGWATPHDKLNQLLLAHTT
jgi:IS30 family transposase